MIGGDTDPVNFGDLPPAIDALLQQGVAAYRTDGARAAELFGQAVAAAPAELATYFCLYKIHTYGGDLDKAVDAARQGLAEAARQAGWPRDWREWDMSAGIPDGAGRFALYTLKALAFIHLRRGERRDAVEILAELRRLDPAGAVGWAVVEALAEGAG